MLPNSLQTNVVVFVCRNMCRPTIFGKKRTTFLKDTSIQSSNGPKFVNPRSAAVSPLFKIHVSMVYLKNIRLVPFIIDEIWCSESTIIIRNEKLRN